MHGSIYLAWRYLWYYKWRTLLLLACITLVAYLPLALHVIVRETHIRLMERSAVTPLVLGARGSPLELVLSTLYFESRSPPIMPASSLTRIDNRLARLVVPLHVRFTARKFPIVGTSFDYFSYRGLQVTSGRMFGILGECVVGSEVARKLGVSVGDSIVSDVDSFVTLAGAYPLKMHITGVLAPTGTADDGAVFVDVKTAWVIEGIGHGHEDLAGAGEANVLSRTEREITASAAVVQYQEITPENVHTFHFHGDPAGFPLTAAIVVPVDERSETLLLGRFANPQDSVQLVVPTVIIRHLMETVFAVRRYLLIAATVVGLSTIVAVGLIFALTIRLRRREIETMVKLGATTWRIRSIFGGEIALVLVGAGVAVLALTCLTSSFHVILLRLVLHA